MSKRHTTSLFLALFFVPTTAIADSGPLGFGAAAYTQEMETDRPDFTEGTQTVQAGHLQLEAGYTFTYDDEDGVKTEDHVLPEALLRVGLVDDLELRIAWEGWSHTEISTAGSDIDEEGGTDMNVGIKHRMYRQDGFVPDFSFIAGMNIPTGADNKTSDDVEPELKLLWAYGLSDALSIAGNVNFAAPIDDADERFFEVSSSLALGYGITDELGAYAEYYGFYPNNDTPQNSTNFLNGGFTYGLNENLQLDIRAGFGLNDEADDFFTGAGLALRI